MKNKSSACLLYCLVIVYTLSCSSCFTYRVATHAQASTDKTVANSVKAYSLFWGIINKPQEIHTPNCDAMDVNGVSEVVVKTNFGNALITVFTLGIYCPVRVHWKCAKPCQQQGNL